MDFVQCNRKLGIHFMDFNDHSHSISLGTKFKLFTVAEMSCAYPN